MESVWEQGVISVRNMSQNGVGVGTMSHKCGRYESGWSRCGKKKRRVHVKSM